MAVKASLLSCTMAEAVAVLTVAIFCTSTAQMPTARLRQKWNAASCVATFTATVPAPHQPSELCRDCPDV